MNDNKNALDQLFNKQKWFLFLHFLFSLLLSKVLIETELLSSYTTLSIVLILLFAWTFHFFKFVRYFKITKEVKSRL